MSDVVNVSVLRERVQSQLAEKCESFERHVQGSHHMTYIARMYNGTKKLVRVEYKENRESGSGLSSPYKMTSEIATMRYVREKSSVPVPKIYGYDADTDGRVGGQWMLMEYVDGQRIDQIWCTMTEVQHERLAFSLAMIWVQLMQLSFPKIGSLYEDCQFIIGPMAFLPSKNHFARAPPDVSKCGPFVTARAWLEATARQELAYELSCSPPPPIAAKRIETVLNLIRSSDDLRSSECWNASHFGLEHVDFSTHNVLVSPTDPTVILSVLDWEGARIVPMWAMNPAFRWPHGSNAKENKRLRALMRSEICARVPGWKEAIGDESRNLRMLCLRAALSDRDPEIVPSDGYLLDMSHE